MDTPLLPAPCRRALIALCAMACCGASAAATPSIPAEPDATPALFVALSVVEAAAGPSGDPHAYAPPLLRAAAAAGPDTLRRYLFRTRMIHNYYYPDWEHLLPEEQRLER